MTIIDGAILFVSVVVAWCVLALTLERWARVGEWAIDATWTQIERLVRRNAKRT